MSRFTPDTERYLLSAGWTAKRQFDPTEDLLLLQSRGIQPSETVVKFLKEFGGLYVTHPQRKVPDVQDIFHFDLVCAISGYRATDIQDILESLGIEACPIGEASSGYIT